MPSAQMMGRLFFQKSALVDRIGSPTSRVFWIGGFFLDLYIVFIPFLVQLTSSTMVVTWGYLARKPQDCRSDQHDPLQVSGHIRYQILFFALILSVICFKTKNTIISLTPEYKGLGIVMHAVALYGDIIRRLALYGRNIANTA